MKQENKTKSVKKFSIKMLLAMVFGGVLGGFFGVFMYYFHGDLEAFLTTWTKMVQSILVPGFADSKYCFHSGWRILPVETENGL